MNPELAKHMAAFFLQGLQHEHEITKRILAAVPDEKLPWRPHEKGRSAGELAWHIATSELWFMSGIAAGKFGPEEMPKPPETTAEIVAFYEKGFPQELAKLQALPPEAMARNLNFMNVFDWPACTYLSLLSNHSIHHRGQLSAYLRAMGEKVPSIYGGSADEPFELPKAQAAS